MVKVFHIPLVLQGKCLHDGVVALAHGMLDIVSPLSDGRDGLVDDQAQAMPGEEMMDFINEYDYEDDETYFYIRTFTFE